MQDPNIVVVTSPVGYAVWQALPNLVCGFALLVLTICVLSNLAKRYKAADYFLNKFGVYVLIIVFVLGFIAPEHISYF
jgi:hypothetical protein